MNPRRQRPAATSDALMLYRLRRRLNALRYRLAASGVIDTPPTPCDPGARCTLHTMLGRDDRLMYLVAVKSFLRFRPPIRVAVHSDGSLTPEDEALFRQHVPGIRVVAAKEADDRAQRELNPFLTEWRRRDASWRRVIDTELWCETPQRIIMDADILTLHRPDAVIDWAAGPSIPSRPLMFGSVDPTPGGPLPEGHGKRHIQDVFRERLVQVGEAAGRPAEFYQGGTSGYYGCTREISLGQIEHMIRAGLTAGVPMSEWGGEQCLVVYLLSTSDPLRLDVRKYFNFAPESIDRLGEAAVVHFYGTFRYYRWIYPRLTAEVVRDLMSFEGRRA